MELTMKWTTLPILCLLCGIIGDSVCMSEDAWMLMKRLMAHPAKVASFPFTLTYAFDGPVGFTYDQHVFKIHNDLLGRRYPEDTIAEGKRAANFFKRRFDVDFTDIPDEMFYLTNVTRNGVLFSYFHASPRSFYRVISATDLHTGIRFNNYVSDGGWSVTFLREYNSTGTFIGTIPTGSAAYYGNYAIRTGVNAEHAAPQNADFPGPVLGIHYNSQTFLQPPHPVTGAFDFACDLSNEHLGFGLARGSGYPVIDDIAQLDANTLWTGGNVLTFPASIPHSSTQV